MPVVTRRRRLVAGATLLLGSMLLPATATAHEPTCTDVLGTDVHGMHVVRDYVMGAGLGAWPPSGGVVGAATGGTGAALPGGPGPAFHFANGYPPGASFCNPQAQSPGSPPGQP